MSSESGMTARDNLWDYARGIGIILVVYGHVLRGLNASGIVPDMHWLMASDYAIYTFHMPLFFVLSGMNAGTGLTKPNFLKNKVLAIVYPYILWSVLQGLVQVILSGKTNTPLYFSDVVPGILWKPLGQFWFLYALFLCHIFIYITTANRERVALFAVGSYAISLYFNFGIFSNALNFFLFYAIGLLMATSLKCLVTHLTKPLGIILIIIGLGLAIFLARQLGNYSAPWALPAALLGVFLILQISAILSRTNKLKIIKLLGLASMPIYLMHILAGSGLRIILSNIGIRNMWVHLVAGLLFGVFASLAIYYGAFLTRKEKIAGFTRGTVVFGK